MKGCAQGKAIGLIIYLSKIIKMSWQNKLELEKYMASFNKEEFALRQLSIYQTKEYFWL